MKYLSKIIFAFMLLCASLVANAVDEVVITAQPYVPDYQTPLPTTTGSFMGISAQVAAQAEGKRIARQSCLDQIKKEAGQSCNDKAEYQYQADLNACSNQAVFGGVSAFLGSTGAGVGLAALGTTPIGWGVALVSVIVGVGGTWVGINGAETCKNSAEAASRYNLQTACPTYVNALQDKNCPKL